MIDSIQRRRLFRLQAVLLAGFIGAGCSGGRALPAQAQAPGAPTPLHPVIPAPVAVAMAPTGHFEVTPDTPILVDPGDSEAARIGLYLANLIGNSLETTPRVAPAGATIPAGAIVLTTHGADAALGEEGYVLAVTPERATITATAPAGLFYGVQTLRQLMPPSLEYTAARPHPLPIPAGRIEDRPRFGWRGAMLDVSRHFLSAEDVKRYIDLMALYKMNRLHVHLSDDQGWRIEIPSWPNLTTHGGSTEVGGGSGGYYTREAFAGLVRYAQDRFITLVPEIDVPGHINAAMASYPALNCDDTAPPLYTGIAVGFSSLCVDKDITYRFLEDVIREITALATGPYFHVGGDEVTKLTHEQYAQFMERVQGIAAAHGKQPIGWDEIAEAPLLPTTLIQHWRPSGSQEAIAEAVAGGARVIISPANKAYLDMKYDSTTVLGLNWAGYVSVRASYEWEPTDQIEGIAESSIVGVEAPLWSETLSTLDDFEYMAFPRLPGIAEIGWSPASGRTWDEYRGRLGAHAPRWVALGINFYRAPEVPWQGN